MVIASRNASACESAAAELQQQHPQGTILQSSCDVSQPDEVQQLAEFAQQNLGQVDIWVNNAGVSQIPKAPLADTAAEQIQQIVSTNMLGALLGSKVAMQTMNGQTSGETPCNATRNRALSYLIHKRAMAVSRNVMHRRLAYLSRMPNSVCVDKNLFHAT